MTTRSIRYLKPCGGTIRSPADFTFTGRNDDISGTGLQINYFHFHYSDQDPSLYTPVRQPVVMPREVHLHDESDRWRYLCPNGHRSWEPTNDHFWCASCARRHGVDGEFETLHDSQEDRRLDRDEVTLQTPASPYKTGEQA